MFSNYHFKKAQLHYKFKKRIIKTHAPHNNTEQNNCQILLMRSLCILKSQTCNMQRTFLMSYCQVSWCTLIPEPAPAAVAPL